MENQQAAETRPELLSALSHELRLEVSAVLHQVELLRADGLDEAARRRSVAAIEANVEGLVSFSDELSELGRIERGDVRPACRSVAVGDLLAQCFDDRAAAFLPASSADTTVYTDPVVVDHIVGSVIAAYRSMGIDESDVVAAVADRCADDVVDLLVGAGLGSVRTATAAASWRPIALDDGLAMFVAHQSARTIGASFAVTDRERPASYRLRLPVSRQDTSGRVHEVCGEQSRHEPTRRLTLLAEAAEHLLRGSGPEELLPRLIGELSEIVGLEIYERFELARDGAILRVSGNGPRQSDGAEASGTDVCRQLCAEAVRRGEPLVRHDLSPADGDCEGEPHAHITAYGCFPLVAAGEVLGAVSFATIGTARFDRDTIELIQTIVDYLAVAERRRRSEAELRAAASELHDNGVQLRELAVDLVRAEQTERQRIAQMLHDDVQQLLFGAQMRLGLLREDVAKHQLADVDSHLDEADRYISESIGKTRHLTAELAPTSLEDDDLFETLEPLVLQMREMHDLEVEVRSASPVLIPDRAIRLLVHQTVRELLFNVVKHAGVAIACIDIDVHGEAIHIEVSDEGSGFAPDEVVADPVRNKRGLATLRQRLRVVGGALSLESVPGDGTRARVIVPTRAGREASR